VDSQAYRTRHGVQVGNIYPSRDHILSLIFIASVGNNFLFCSLLLVLVASPHYSLFFVLCFILTVSHLIINQLNLLLSLSTASIFYTPIPDSIFYSILLSFLSLAPEEYIDRTRKQRKLATASAYELRQKKSTVFSVALCADLWVRVLNKRKERWAVRDYGSATSKIRCSVTLSSASHAIYPSNRVALLSSSYALSSTALPAPGSSRILSSRRSTVSWRAGPSNNLGICIQAPLPPAVLAWPCRGEGVRGS
jgi:hypothetical protein